MMRRLHHHDQQSRVFYELSALVLNLLRSPPTPIQFSDEVSTSSSRQLQPPPLQQITPAGFASLLLGISLALMLCGSITFFIGFLLMPWVLGLVMVFYVAGIVSSLSMLGRAIFCYTLSPSSPRKSVPEPHTSSSSLSLTFVFFYHLLLESCPASTKLGSCCERMLFSSKCCFLGAAAVHKKKEEFIHP